MRHADARGQRADVVASGRLRQPVAEPGVVDGAEEQHQAERRQDAAEHQIVRHLEDEAQKPGQHEHVDEDVGAEAEERVPVARNPPALLRSCRRRHGHRSAPFVDLQRTLTLCG